MRVLYLSDRRPVKIQTQSCQGLLCSGSQSMERNEALVPSWIATYGPSMYIAVVMGVLLFIAARLQ